MTINGTAFLKNRDLEAAEKWLLEALAMRRTAPDGEDKQAAELLSALAHLRHWQQDFAETERLARESIEICRRLQQDDPGLARTLNYLADARYERGDLADAEGFFREGLTIMRRNGTNDPGTFQWSLYALAETLERQNKFTEAEPLYRELLARPDADGPTDDNILTPAIGATRCLIELAWLEQQEGKFVQALSHAREAEVMLRAGVATQPQPSGNRAWQLAEMKSRLVGALVVATVADAALQPTARLSEFAEVEPLLLESQERLQNDPVVRPEFKRDAINRLVRLYDVWNDAAPSTGKSEKATQWRLKLASFDKAEAERKAVASKPKPPAENRSL
jgi:tetratricopeptide (TPR) repeat protein